MCTITVNTATAEDYHLILTDITGRQLKTISSSGSEKGKFVHKLQLSDKLTAGIYFLTLKTTKNEFSKKVMIGN